MEKNLQNSRGKITTLPGITDDIFFDSMPRGVIDSHGDMLSPSAEVSFTKQTIKLEHIHNQHQFNKRLMDSFTSQNKKFIIEEFLERVKCDIDKLTEKGIDVFIPTKRMETIYDEVRDYYAVSVTYMVKEEDIYKTFFVDGVNDEGLKRATDYAKNKIHKFIDNYGC